MYGLSSLLHRRAEGRRGARADHARRARPRTSGSSSARRSPTRPATSASSSASIREVGVLEADELTAAARGLEQHLNDNFGRLFDEMLKSRVDRLAQRARGHRGAGRGGDALPHGDRGDAGPHRPALHHGLQRTRGDAAGLRRGLPERRPRRAPPRRLRLRFLREKASARTTATRRRSSAPWRRRCRSPTGCSTRPGPRRRTTANCSATRSTRRASSPAQCLTAASRSSACVGARPRAVRPATSGAGDAAFFGADSLAARLCCFGAE